MNDVPMLILAIIGSVMTWTGSVIAIVLWLSGRFRHIEITLYRELNKHRTEIDTQIHDLRNRIIHLELKATGVSKAP
jgi:hypothetical protein